MSRYGPPCSNTLLPWNAASTVKTSSSPACVLTHNGFLRVHAAPKNTHTVPDLAYLTSPGEHPRGDQANLLRPFRLAAAVSGTALKGRQLLFQGCGGILRATLQLVGVLAQIVELFFAALVANVDLFLTAHA